MRKRDRQRCGRRLSKRHELFPLNTYRECAAWRHHAYQREGCIQATQSHLSSPSRSHGAPKHYCDPKHYCNAVRRRASHGILSNSFSHLREVTSWSGVFWAPRTGPCVAGCPCACQHNAHSAPRLTQRGVATRIAPSGYPSITASFSRISASFHFLGYLSGKATTVHQQERCTARVCGGARAPFWRPLQLGAPTP